MSIEKIFLERRHANRLFLFIFSSVLGLWMIHLPLVEQKAGKSMNLFIYPSMHLSLYLCAGVVVGSWNGEAALVREVISGYK